MSVPKEFIQGRLLPAVDMVELVSRYLPLKKQGSDYKCCCPFHREKTPSFHVNSQTQTYHCFGCQAHGNAIDFLMRYRHLDFLEALEELGRFAGIEIEYTHDKSQRYGKSNDRYYEAMDRIASFFTSQLMQTPAALDYFKGQRQLSDETILKARLGYAPRDYNYIINSVARDDEDLKLFIELGVQNKKKESNRPNDKGYAFFRDRVIFPIFNVKGKIIGFGGRQLHDGDGPKYLNIAETPIFQKRRELFGLYECLEAHMNKPETIVLVEGYMDVIALRQAGIDYAVAALGTATTPEHFALLFHYTNKVVCCYDGDTAGQRAALHAAQVIWPCLTGEKQVRFLTLPASYDPDSLVREQGAKTFEYLISNALSFPEYIIFHQQSLYKVSDPNDFTRFLNSTLSICKAMEQTTYVIPILQLLSSYTKTPFETLIKMMGSYTIKPNQDFLRNEPQFLNNPQNIPGPLQYQSPSSLERYRNKNPIYNIPDKRDEKALPCYTDLMSSYPLYAKVTEVFAKAEGYAPFQGQRKSYYNMPWEREQRQGQQFQNRNKRYARDAQPNYAEVHFYQAQMKAKQGETVSNLEPQNGVYVGSDFIPKSYSEDRMPKFDNEACKEAEHDTHSGRVLDSVLNTVPLPSSEKAEAQIVRPEELEELNLRPTPEEEKEFFSIVGKPLEQIEYSNPVYDFLAFILQQPTIVGFNYKDFQLDEVLKLCYDLHMDEYPAIRRVLLTIRYQRGISSAILLETYRGTAFFPLFIFLMTNPSFCHRDVIIDSSEEILTDFLAFFIFKILKAPFQKRVEYLQTLPEMSPEQIEESYELHSVLNLVYDNAQNEEDRLRQYNINKQEN